MWAYIGCSSHSHSINMFALPCALPPFPPPPPPLLRSYLDFGFASDEVTSLHCFGVMNCIQCANRTRQNFAVVENSAGSCYLKMQQMAGVALIF